MLPQFMDSIRLILSGPRGSDLAALPAELLASGLRALPTIDTLRIRHWNKYLCVRSKKDADYLH
jgi:hypothetical protein